MDSQIADTIHGFPVIRTTHWFPRIGHLRPARIVIVDRIAEEYAQRYVVAAQYATDTRPDREWHQGDYCSTLEEADKAFVERRKREFERHER